MNMTNNNSLLNRLERKFGNFGIPNLMTLIVFFTAVAYFGNYLVDPDAGFSLSSLLYFDRDAIFRGEVWRIITFAFIPPASSPIFIAFSLYLDWIIGSTLEKHWGTFRFNVYYFMGMLGNIIAGLITGYATNDYLNMSLFFAFAMLYADFQILLFFVLPLRVIWLAWLEAALLCINFLTTGWQGRIVILVSIANFLLFFGKDLWNSIRRFLRRMKNRLKKRHSGDQGGTNWKDHWWNDSHNDPFH